MVDKQNEEQNSGQQPQDATDDVPAGDMPPTPKHRLVVGAAIWVIWMVFLIAMMLFRMNTSAV